MFSVIICTYNPREDYLTRALDGLRQQTLPLDEWEFLLIDNNSKIPVERVVDLSWHSNARVVVEPKQGLTAARVCAIREAKGELLLFVDDDNILATNYLENAIQLLRKFPDLGCFGATVLKPEFEIEPLPELKGYTSYLAVREDADTRMSKLAFESGCMPWGAGMCVRADVARGFSELVNGDASLSQLGRKGQSLLSGEDLLFSWVACREGYQIGIFEELTLVHLIDRKRTTKDYLVRIASGQAYSATSLQIALGEGARPVKGLGVISLIKGLFWKRPQEIIPGIPFVIGRWKARRKAAGGLS